MKTDIPPEKFAELSKLFDHLSRERWVAGAEAYGPTAFMKNDVLRMMIEELVDMANYARMQVIKMLYIAELAENQSTSMGADDFRGTGEGWPK